MWVLWAIETEKDSANKFLLFSDATGKCEKEVVYEDYMLKSLEKVQARYLEHIPAGLEVKKCVWPTKVMR